MMVYRNIFKASSHVAISTRKIVALPLTSSSFANVRAYQVSGPLSKEEQKSREKKHFHELFLSLSYLKTSGRVEGFCKFFEEQGATQYEFKTNLLDRALYAFAIGRTPALELVVTDQGLLDDEIHITAANREGETLIIALLNTEKDIHKASRGVVRNPLEVALKKLPE